MRHRRAMAAVAVSLLLAITACSSKPAPAPLPVLTAPAHARALYFGDSWTYGYSAAPGQGFASVSAASLGWTLVSTPDGSGTGFTHFYPGATAGLTYPDRAKALGDQRADVIVLEGGINDVGFPLTGYAAAVRATIQILRAHVGHQAPVVLLGPPQITFPGNDSLKQVDRLLRRAAAANDAFYVSPYRERWVTRQNVGYVIDPKTGHPSTAGHAYIAARLVAAVEQLEWVPTGSGVMPPR